MFMCVLNLCNKKYRKDKTENKENTYKGKMGTG